MAHDLERLARNVEKWRHNEYVAIWDLRHTLGTKNERAARKELTRVLDASAKAYKRLQHARDEH